MMRVLKKHANRKHLSRCGLRLLRFVGNLSLWCVFIFWGFEAIEKFVSRPTSSSVAFTYGDDNRGRFRMPTITICLKKYETLIYYRLKAAGKCFGSNGYVYDFNNVFHEYVSACLESTQSTTSTTTEGGFFGIFDTEQPTITKFSTMKELLDVLHIEMTDILHSFSMGNFKTGTSLSERKWWFKQLWVPAFDLTRGQCFTFDPSLSNLTWVEKGRANLKMRFLFDLINEDNPPIYTVQIHDSIEDRFDAYNLNPVIFIEKSKRYEVKLTKTVMKSLNQEHSKCVEEEFYGIEKCKHFKGTQAFIDEYNCTLPWMINSYEFTNYTRCESDSANGVELVHLIETSLKMYESAEPNCLDYLPCNRSIYQDTVKEKPYFDTHDVLQSELIIQYSTPFIQVIKDSWSYDMQSFIGEVGGTLGLLLGFSFSSLFDLLEFFANKF